jgi:ferric-dicitrate binding protein FerR (iron transport regulator)
MNEEVLFKYISGQANSEEKSEVQHWVDESDDRKKELIRLKNVWIMSGLENEPEHINKEEEINRIWGIIREMTGNTKNKSLRMTWLKYAAAILLLVGISGTVGYFLSNSGSESSYTEIYVPKGERSTVVLPDGSTVQLNSDSHLKFRSSFSAKKRDVTLEGEGFFKVVHDKDRPFVVETPTMQVQVLGTVFNVCSYPTDSIATTFLQSGKVKINSNKRDEIFLSPNEVFTYNKTTHESAKSKIQDQRFTDWTKGILTIKEETIGELSKKLERRFNIQIRFGDNEVKEHIYTGSIKDEDLNTLLEALTFVSSINYKKEGNTITLFSKK